jgi:hypothetical protein
VLDTSLDGKFKPGCLGITLFGRQQVPVRTYCLGLRTGSPDGRQKSRVAKRRKNMDRYLIETPHTGEECLDLIKVLNAQGYLWNFDWGCKAGIHSGWAVIEAENDEQARLAVPPLVRTRARIVKLNKFDGSTIEECEKQEAGVTKCAGR